MRALALILSLCLLAAAALTPLPALAQSDDRDFVTRFLEDSLSGENRNVTITGFQGALSSRATIAEMTISDDQGVWLTLRGAVLDWNRAALLRGRVSINELSAEEVIVARAPVTDDDAIPSAEAPGFALPELPVSVNVRALRAERVGLGEALIGEEAVFTVEGSLSLDGGDGQAALEIIRTDGPEARFVLAGDYSNATGALAVDLEVVEGQDGIAAGLIGLPGNPELSLTIDGEGTLDDFAAEIALVTDGVERLAGNVRLIGDEDAQRFSVDLGGDIAPLFAPDYAEFFGDRIALVTEGARYSDGRLELSALDLTARAIELSGDLVIGADNLPRRIDLTGRIASPEGTPVLLPLSGPRTEIGLLDLIVAYDQSDGEGWRLDLSGTDLLREDISIQAFSLDGSGRIVPPQAGDGRLVDGAITFAVNGLETRDPALGQALGSEIAGETQLLWQDGEPLRLSGLRLQGETYGLDGALQVEGLDAALRLTTQAEARLDDLSRFSGLAGRDLSGAATAVVDGSFEVLSGQFDADVVIRGRDLTLDQPEADRLLAGESRIDLSARRTTEGIDLRGFTLSAGTLSAEASGRLGGGESDITAEIEFSDLSVLGGPYGGALSADARLVEDARGQRISARTLGRDLTVGVAEADALLAGESRIDLDALISDGSVTLDRLAVNAATLRATAAGLVVEGASDVTARLEFSDLGVLGGPYGGVLEADARLVDEAGGQRVTAEARGRDLSIGQAEVDGLLSGDSRIGAEVLIGDGTVTIDRLEVTAATLSAAFTGLLAEGASRLNADLEFSDLSALGPRYRGALSAEATVEEDGTLRRVEMSATTRDIAIGQAEADRLLAGESALTLAATEDQGRFHLERLRLSNPQLTAEAEGTVEGDERRVDLTARLGNLGLFVPEFPGPVTLGGQVSQSADGFRIALDGSGPGGISARVAGTAAADFATADLSITGQAQAALGNAFIAPRTVQGPVSFDLAMRGTPGLAALSGTIRAPGLRLSDPEFGLVLDGSEVTLGLSGGQANVNVTTNVQGGGQLSVSGPVTLSAPFNANLSLAARGVRLSDPQLYETTVAGDLTISGPLTGGGRIAGTVNVGETNLRIPSGGGSTIGAIPDLIHVGEPPEVRATRARAGLIGGNDEGGGGARPFALDVTVNAPNRIFIRGRGLDAELGGTLRIGGTTADIVPSGGLDLIRGRLDLLGRRFNLNEGSATLQGRLVPFIRLVATTEADGTVVQIIIEGEASEPVITFRSVPELPEEEVLARLLFGRDITAISPLQAAQLASAIATLAGRGGDGIVSRLRQGFGLDDLDVVTGEDGTAAVRAGRYLSENIYTDVTVGADGKTELNLNLDVSPSVTVRGRLGSDGNTGLGVFFERDY
jgi:translocation and assembly module TamB